LIGKLDPITENLISNKNYYKFYPLHHKLSENINDNDSNKDEAGIKISIETRIDDKVQLNKNNIFATNNNSFKKYSYCIIYNFKKFLKKLVYYVY
jgi:hypothetical protein